MSTIFVKETGAGKLQVEKKFEELVKVATGKASLYIKAKESMLDYFVTDASAASLSEREKAEMLSKLVADMAISMTGKLMDTALKIETENRDAPYMLAKVVADVKATDAQADKVGKDTKLIAAQTAKIRADVVSSVIANKSAVAAAFSKTGLKLVTDLDASAPFGGFVPVVGSTDQASIASAYASRYASLASSFRKDGTIAVSLSTDGYNINDLTATGTYIGLAEAQKNVAIRNEQGFDDNMLQHAVNSSANLMGLMISDGNAGLLSEAVPTGGIPNIYFDALGKLVNAAVV